MYEYISRKNQSVHDLPFVAMHEFVDFVSLHIITFRNEELIVCIIGIQFGCEFSFVVIAYFVTCLSFFWQRPVLLHTLQTSRIRYYIAVFFDCVYNRTGSGQAVILILTEYDYDDIVVFFALDAL